MAADGTKPEAIEVEVPAIIRALVAGVETAVAPISAGIAQLLRNEQERQERLHAIIQENERLIQGGAGPGPVVAPPQPEPTLRIAKALASGDGRIAAARVNLPNGDGVLIYRPGAKEGGAPQLAVEKPSGLLVTYTAKQEEGQG